MEKPNKHWSYDKVRNTIRTCKTHEQLSVANELITNFGIMFGTDEDFKKLLDCHRFYKNKLENKLKPAI